MQLLYLDHSGAPDDPSQRYVVLAGLSVFERQTHWLATEVETIAARFNAADPTSVEIHAHPMRTGRDFWRGIPVSDRLEAIADCCRILAKSIDTTVLFAAAIEKSALKSGDVISVAFEEICKRFDANLKYLHQRRNTQRGIIVLDEASYERTVQNLATDFKNIGRDWGVTRNLSEVPLFLNSKASRLLQLADVVAYAVRRHYEHNDSRFFDLLGKRFDQRGSVSHGLFHLSASSTDFQLTP